MAESSWPNPADGRSVDDVQYEKLAAYYGGTGGVMGEFSSPQLVYGDSSGMQIKIGADRHALVRGHVWWSGSTIVTKAIAANASGSTRVDLVVLRLDRATWAVNLVVLTGTPGSGAPSPTQWTGTTSVWDLPLATVTVASGAVTISAGSVNYVASHLRSDGGGLRTNSYPYVPQPFPGQKVLTSDGISATYNGSDFLETWGWRDYTPTVYHQISGTRTALGGITVHHARYLKRHRLVHVILDLTCANASSNGTSVSLPSAATAGRRHFAIGVGGVYGASPPTQTGVVSMAPGPPHDSIMFTTFTNAFVSVPAAHVIRCTFTYESDVASP